MRPVPTRTQPSAHLPLTLCSGSPSYPPLQICMPLIWPKKCCFCSPDLPPCPRNMAAHAHSPLEQPQNPNDKSAVKTAFLKLPNTSILFFPPSSRLWSMNGGFCLLPAPLPLRHPRHNKIPFQSNNLLSASRPALENGHFFTFRLRL